MMNHPDAISQIERTLEWQVQDVSLYDMHVWQIPRVPKGRFYRIRQIDADNGAGFELSGQEYVASLSAARIQNDSVFEVRRSEGRNPSQEFLLVRIRQSRIVGPLIAKCVRRGFLFRCKGFSQEARNAADDWEPGSATLADKAAVYHLRGFNLRGNHVETAAAGRARQ